MRPLEQPGACLLGVRAPGPQQLPQPLHRPLRFLPLPAVGVQSLVPASPMTLALIEAVPVRL